MKKEIFSEEMMSLINRFAVKNPKNYICSDGSFLDLWLNSSYELDRKNGITYRIIGLTCDPERYEDKFTKDNLICAYFSFTSGDKISNNIGMMAIERSEEEINTYLRGRKFSLVGTGCFGNDYSNDDLQYLNKILSWFKKNSKNIIIVTNNLGYVLIDKKYIQFKENVFTIGNPGIVTLSVCKSVAKKLFDICDVSVKNVDRSQRFLYEKKNENKIAVKMGRDEIYLSDGISSEKVPLSLSSSQLFTRAFGSYSSIVFFKRRISQNEEEPLWDSFSNLSFSFFGNSPNRNKRKNGKEFPQSYIASFGGFAPENLEDLLEIIRINLKYIRIQTKTNYLLNEDQMDFYFVNHYIIPDDIEYRGFSGIPIIRPNSYRKTIPFDRLGEKIFYLGNLGDFINEKRIKKDT